MEKIISSSLFAFLFFVVPARAQQKPEEVSLNKFITLAGKDTAYARFRSELSRLTEIAHGRVTNAVAVKALLERNKPMLQTIYRKYNLPSTAKFMQGSPQHATTKKINITLPKGYKDVSATGIPNVIVPPYSNVWSNCEIINSPYPIEEIPASNNAAGNILFNVRQPIPVFLLDMFNMNRGFTKRITVPADPLILAARVRFDYSFFYTGWETQGARTGIHLALQASTNFNSASFFLLPDTPAVRLQNPRDRWRVIDILLPLDTVNGDFGELHASLDSSFTFEGYIKPGSELEFKIGFGYMEESIRGVNGFYHYGEFRLKKITITYLKSGN